MNKLLALLLMMNLSCLLSTRAQAPMDGGVWKDNTGKHINAHGGNIFNYKGTYYWYGESRSEDGKPYSSLGVSCFTSKDLKTGPITDSYFLFPKNRAATSRAVASSSARRFSTIRKPRNS